MEVRTHDPNPRIIGVKTVNSLSQKLPVFNSYSYLFITKDLEKNPKLKKKYLAIIRNYQASPNVDELLKKENIPPERIDGLIIPNVNHSKQLLFLSELAITSNNSDLTERVNQNSGLFILKTNISLERITSQDSLYNNQEISFLIADFGKVHRGAIDEAYRRYKRDLMFPEGNEFNSTDFRFVNRLLEVSSYITEIFITAKDWADKIKGLIDSE